MHKTLRPADIDKVANLAQHPNSLGTTGLHQYFLEGVLTLPVLASQE